MRKLAGFLPYINLSPDKDAVFREAFRVLRPGGRLHVSDVVLLHALSEAEQQDLELWAGCISGALLRDDYRAKLEAAGFADVTLEVEDYINKEGNPSSKPWRSALIEAHKPGGAARRATMTRSGDTIEFIAVPGLQTGACCGSGEEGSACCP